MTADAGGSMLSSMRYTAFGETRYAAGSTSTDYRYTGQREEAELGLYYRDLCAPERCLREGYVARWYDPALGRFIQADSMVPNPGNPMDWDRYAYGLNNPVKYNDPTGHAVSCEYGDDCKHLAPSPKTILTAEYYVGYLKATGITINGNIRVEDARMFFNAFHKMNAALHWKFKEFVGSSTFNFKYVSDGHYGGVWRGNKTINFYATNAGQLPEINVFHEMGHLIENDILGGKPSADLESNTFNDSNGNFVMGVRNGSYDRQTCLGYDSGCNPQQPWNYEQHPRSWEPDGNTGGEEFADMFLNYVAGTIDMEVAPGITRFNFMSRWLP